LFGKGALHGKEEGDRLGLRAKRSTTASAIERGGKSFGEIAHPGQRYPG
jgi:hypothetical protein